MVYILGDSLGRIKLAQKQSRQFVKLRYSRLLVDVLQIMYNSGAIRGFTISPDHLGGKVIVFLKYVKGLPLMKDIKLVSRPGFRKYLTLGEFLRQYFKLSRQGFFVISTPQGLISSVDLFVGSRFNIKLTGEVLLQVIY